MRISERGKSKVKSDRTDDCLFATILKESLLTRSPDFAEKANFFTFRLRESSVSAFSIILVLISLILRCAGLNFLFVGGMSRRSYVNAPCLIINELIRMSNGFFCVVSLDASESRTNW